LDRLFVEREFFLRTDGKVHYQRITRRFQMTVAAVCLLGATWLAYASVNVVFHTQIVAGKAEEIERQRLAYFDLLDEVSEYHEQFTRITRNLEGNQAYLLSLVARDGQEGDELATLAAPLKDSANARARVEIAREGLRRRLVSFESELSEIADGDPGLAARVEAVLETFSREDGDSARTQEARAHLGQRLDEVESELTGVLNAKRELEAALRSKNEELKSSESTRRELSEDKEALNSDVRDLEDRLSQARERQSQLEEQIALDDAVGQGEQLENERGFLNTRVAGLEQRLIDMRDTQRAIVSRLTERTLLSIDTFEDTVAMTGIDVDSLLSELPANDQDDDSGGPFIPDDYVVEEDPVFSLQSSIAVLDLQMDRWEGLQEVVRSLPLTAPLDQFRITSGFGARRDPVNGRKSRHHGVDLGAPMRTPIMATAPGKVVFAGWKGHYGRVIEIDHGHGIRTRYGHLRKILVKVGQQVAHREEIGLLGSSGRSTGPHVHYEVQVKRKPLNPLNFLEAGQNVFKG
jgi:murein DD-endopeptidase MepM/ murein hydrolase activator NlpD